MKASPTASGSSPSAGSACSALPPSSGCLTIGVFRSAAALRFAESREEQILLAALALIVALNIVDLLPNSGLRPWSWLLAGSLLGRAEALRALARQKSRQARARVGMPSPQPAAASARVI